MQATQGLSSDQVSSYRREGYLLLPEPVFPQEKFAKLRNHFENKLAALDPTCRPEGMDVPHFADPALFEWLFADEVLDLIEPLIGPNIALFSSHFICKPKGDGRRVPWHEDSAYWGKRLEPMEVVTLWLAIDPATKENGCMHVIPRTQHNGYSDYEPVDTKLNVFGTEIKASQRDMSRVVACELEVNHASLHDAKLVHGSPPNHSQIRRCGYTMRYMPTHVKLNEQSDTHQIYLARGKDLAGNRYGDPTRSYAELGRYRQQNKGNGH